MDFRRNGTDPGVCGEASDGAGRFIMDTVAGTWALRGGKPV
jgi:hypothetical protein